MSESALPQWRIAAGRYAATFGFVTEAGPFASCLSVRSLTRDGAELLVAPGAPLVMPWIGRLSGTSFALLGRRLDVGADPGVHYDEQGRPLHGVAPDPSRWSAVAGGHVFEAVAEVAAQPAFPWSYRVVVRGVVGEDGLEVRTELGTTGGVTVPVAVGWHPYLRAPGTRPDATGVEVYVPFGVSCRLEALLPTGDEVPVSPRWLGDPVIDAHWRAGAGAEAVVRSGEFEVGLAFGEGYGWAMTWVPHRGAGFVCVEPMAAPLDPFGGAAEVAVVTSQRPWQGVFALR